MTNASAVISKNDFKERFINRTFLQYKTLKSAFISWKLVGESTIDLERFKQLIKMWAFIVSDK